MKKKHLNNLNRNSGLLVRVINLTFWLQLLTPTYLNLDYSGYHKKLIHCCSESSDRCLWLISIWCNPADVLLWLITQLITLKTSPKLSWAHLRKLVLSIYSSEGGLQLITYCNLVDLFFFVECYLRDHASAENNTGNLNPVPIAIAVTNTGTEVTAV